MLTSRYKAMFDGAIRPLAVAVARTGISPTAITLAAPLLTSLACLWFVQTRRILPFCLVMVVIGCLDWLDGAVARASGRTSQFGAYLDAVCDRYVEILVMLAAAAVTGYWLLSMVTVAGALLISYAKARAAMEAPIANQEWPDLMERTERSLVFGVGLAASALVPWRPLGRDLFWWTLVLLAILLHATVLQRVLRARRLIQARAGPASELFRSAR